MKDFETTQFLSIFGNIEDSFLQESLEEIFRNTKFGLKRKEEVDHLKLKYFSDFILDYFYELDDEDFMGEFDDWENVNVPPEAIKQFVACVNKVLKIRGVHYIYIILTNYACEGETTNGIVECKLEEVYYNLFSVSSYWIVEDGLKYEDNLIIKVTQ